MKDYNGYETINKDEIEQIDSLKGFMKEYNKKNTYNPGYIRIYKDEDGKYKIYTIIEKVLKREKIKISYGIEAYINMKNGLINMAHIYGNRSIELFLNTMVKNKKAEKVDIRYNEDNQSEFTRKRGVPVERIEFIAIDSNNNRLFSIEINHIYNVSFNKMINPDRC